MSTVLVVLLVGLTAVLVPLRRPVSRVPERRVTTVRGRRDPVPLDDAAVALTLLAACLRGGTGTVEALEAVARVDPWGAGRELGVVAAAHRWGVAPDLVWTHVGPGWSAAAAAWHAAADAGAAPATLLEDAARRMREEDSRRTEAAVHRAGVLLVLPLGLCFLPGFVATTVVPVVLLLLGDGPG